MSLFATPYKRIMQWMLHHKTTRYLYGLSFIEAVIFPVPPDIMLAPMCAARPDNALRLAAMTTLFSVAGGILGYVIGFFIFEQIEPWLMSSRFADGYGEAKILIDEWGVWIIVTAGFSPVPYKIFTLGAGVLEQNFILFFIASVIGRGARFFLLALLLRRLGPAMLVKIEQRIEVVGWTMAFIVLAAIIFYYLAKM